MLTSLILAATISAAQPLTVEDYVSVVSISSPVLSPDGKRIVYVATHADMGTMLYRLLQELGVDVTMVTYPRAQHVPREPKQQIDIMRRNVEFFSQYVLSPQK
jgi:dipeptidyl aminopeptidase/acylaminoacyl peptidase